MKTMLNPGSSLSNPAERFLQWNGKAESVKIKGSDEVEKEGGFLYYQDKDNDYEVVKLKLPFVIYPLGESMSIEGGMYDATNKANNTFISSNEFGGWDEPITVYERHIGDDHGVVIARGTYQDIKETVKAHKGKVRTNLYGLCSFSDKKIIVRLQLGRSAGRALSDFRRKLGASFYERPLIITGTEYKTTGSSEYAVPKFSSGEPYDDAAIKGLEDYAKTISEYGNALQQKNLNSANQTVITDETSDEEYEKEMSKEPEASAEEEQAIDLSGVPF